MTVWEGGHIAREILYNGATVFSLRKLESYIPH